MDRVRKLDGQVVSITYGPSIMRTILRGLGFDTPKEGDVELDLRSMIGTPPAHPDRAGFEMYAEGDGALTRYERGRRPEDLDAAEAALARTMAAYPKDLWSRHRMAIVKTYRGQHAEAIALFQYVGQHHPPWKASCDAQVAEVRRRIAAG